MTPKEAFSHGWTIAVKWILNCSLAQRSSEGINPSGKAVSDMMKELPQVSGLDAGFGEGLIWAIGKPIEVIKKHLKK